MPLEVYEREGKWWIRGRITLNGRAISPYIRRSSGASSEQAALLVAAEIERLTQRRHIVGEESSLSWNDAVFLYNASPKEAGYLLAIQHELADKLVAEITPEWVREMAKRIYPHCSTDTMKRCVLTPISAVINNAHDKGKCPPIRIKGFSAKERIAHDAERGKQSRTPKRPGDWQWINSLRGHASPHVQAGVEFMFETGARIGQLIAIKPTDVDIPKKRVWLIAQKGHPAQWVTVSHELIVMIANLKPKRPHNSKKGERLDARVFGYATRGGFSSALRKGCEVAGIDYRPPHSAGRHGFYTELRVRQQMDPVTAAKMGRWAKAALPDAVYAHVEDDEAMVREQIRTARVQSTRANTVKPRK